MQPLAFFLLAISNAAVPLERRDSGAPLQDCAPNNLHELLPPTRRPNTALPHLQYPWSGVTVEHPRRDKRKGRHRAHVARSESGDPCIMWVHSPFALTFSSWAGAVSSQCGETGDACMMRVHPFFVLHVMSATAHAKGCHFVAVPAQAWLPAGGMRHAAMPAGVPCPGCCACLSLCRREPLPNTSVLLPPQLRVGGAVRGPLHRHLPSHLVNANLEKNWYFCHRSCEWEEPFAGRCTDTFSLSNCGLVLTQLTDMSIAATGRRTRYK